MVLISSAERGFLYRLEHEGAPLFRWRGTGTEEEWLAVQAQFLAGLHLTDALDAVDWPDAKAQLTNWFGSS